MTKASRYPVELKERAVGMVRELERPRTRLFWTYDRSVWHSVARGSGQRRAVANKLYYGDNLDVLRKHISDESVDMIYLDPSSNSNRSYNVLFQEMSE